LKEGKMRKFQKNPEDTLKDEGTLEVRILFSNLEANILVFG